MNKGVSGSLLLFGLLLAIFCGVALQSTPDPLDPSQDFAAELWTYARAGGLIIGLALFFFGAMRFSRGS